MCTYYFLTISHTHSSVFLRLLLSSPCELSALGLRLELRLHQAGAAVYTSTDSSPPS